MQAAGTASVITAGDTKRIAFGTCPRSTLPGLNDLNEAVRQSRTALKGIRATQAEQQARFKVESQN